MSVLKGFSDVGICITILSNCRLYLTFNIHTIVEAITNSDRLYSKNFEYLQMADKNYLNCPLHVLTKLEVNIELLKLGWVIFP